jgi:hypothetical protein
MTPQSEADGGVSATTSGVRDELAQDAGRLKQTVTDRARQEAESRKGEVVQVAGSASAALQSAADDLQNNPDAPDWMATALQQAARQIDRLAGQVEGRSVSDLGGEVAQFARSNPVTFLAASAAAGFAAARVLRAGVDRQSHDEAGGGLQSPEYAPVSQQDAAGGAAGGFSDLRQDVGNDIEGIAP